MGGKHAGEIFSEVLRMVIEGSLETYGVKVESTISEKTIFMKVYKN